MIRLINESFSCTTSKKYDLTLEQIEAKLSECASRMCEIKEQFEETKATWKSLQEDVEGMSFGNYVHTGLQEQFKQTLSDLKSEYNTLKSVHKEYEALKAKITEAPETSNTIWVQKDISEDADTDGYVYSGNGGRSWVREDSEHIDTWATKEEAVEDGYNSFKEEFEYGVDWTVVPLESSTSVLKEDLASVFDRYYHDASSRQKHPTMFNYADRLMATYNIDENDIKGTFNNASEDVQLRMIELVAPRVN